LCDCTLGLRPPFLSPPHPQSKNGRLLLKMLGSESFLLSVWRFSFRNLSRSGRSYSSFPYLSVRVRISFNSVHRFAIKGRTCSPFFFSRRRGATLPLSALCSVQICHFSSSHTTLDYQETSPPSRRRHVPPVGSVADGLFASPGGRLVFRLRHDLLLQERDRRYCFSPPPLEICSTLFPLSFSRVCPLGLRYSPPPHKNPPPKLRGAGPPLPAQR